MKSWLILVCLQLWGGLDLCPAQEDTSSCPRPPQLENGDTKLSAKFQYHEGERVEYICQRYYVMDGGPHRICIGGEWRGEITCLRPCTVTNEDMVSHRIALKFRHNSKMYATHNDWIQFRCVAGTTNTYERNMRQRCNDGVLHMPTCEDPRSR